MPKKIDRREQITKLLMGLPLRGRPGGRRTGTKPGKRSIPKAWRDLDKGCLEFALSNLSDDNLDDEQFVSCAVRRARVHDRNGDYKITKLSSKSTGPRKPRAHEQRVRQLAKEVLKERDRASLEI